MSFVLNKSKSRLLQYLLFFSLLLLMLLLMLNITSCQQMSWLEDGNSGQIYSRLDYKNTEPSNKDVKRIVIVGTNDFHGNIDGHVEKISIGVPSATSATSATSASAEGKINYGVGGATIIAGYFKILRQRYGKELLLLDAGDMYSGTLISDSFKGESVVKLYDYLGYDAVTFGNHEFDYGPEILSRRVPEKEEDPQGALKKAVGTSKVPFVVSNVLDLSTGKPIEWPGSTPMLVKDINGVKVGIIAATTPDTPDKTIRENVRGLYFDNMASVVVKMAREVRYKGAQVVVLLIHAGDNCETPVEKSKINSAGNDSKYKKDFTLCDPQDELFKLLKTIPQNTVDAIVSGHTHTNIAHFYNETPVIQSFNNGKYFGQMELFYDLKEKKLLRDKTIIYSPTKFCHQFFSSSGDCNKPKDTGKNATEKLVAAKFLDKEVEEDKDVSNVLKTYKDGVAKMGETIICSLDASLVHERSKESQLGTLVADALRFVGKADVAVTNSGGVRVSLPEGKITFNDIYRALPFENYLVTMPILGSDLIKLVRLGTSNQQGVGFANFSGLKIWLSHKEVAAPEDIDGNGKIDGYEKNYVQKVTFSNGTPIKENKTYTIATQNFLAIFGGDNYGVIFKKIADNQKIINYNVTYRDAAITYINYMKENKKHIHSKNKSYLETTESRIYYVD
ncbi:MAG: 5'-nucleotidase C-terminal domain-containing protein [Oligoflexia bacterium]|nr:5'-nucleotidase C-terminal domain-containing protein [Oligoflexia bacterium]